MFYVSKKETNFVLKLCGHTQHKYMLAPSTSDSVGALCF